MKTSKTNRADAARRDDARASSTNRDDARASSTNREEAFRVQGAARATSSGPPVLGCRIEAQWMRVGDDELAVLCVSVDDSLLLEGLTTAEMQVALELIHGKSNAEIARQRGTKERTVANQITTIFRKLGVASRTELLAMVMRTRLGPEGKSSPIRELSLASEQSSDSAKWLVGAIRSGRKT